MYPSDPDVALVARSRFENAGWRRWAMQKILKRKQPVTAGDCTICAPTPSPSQPGSPILSRMLTSFHDFPVDGSYVLVPVPAHLVAPVQLFAQRLQESIPNPLLGDVA